MEFSKNAVNVESSQITKPTKYVMAARDDGLVREEKNNRVVSREDTTQLTEVEDVRHFGDFSDTVSHSLFTLINGKIRIFLHTKLLGSVTISD